jgi:cytochrome c-type biogenesis protein CcmH
MRALAALLLAGFLAVPALAVEPSERLADPVLEARARALSQGLRCLVCQNESIDESGADLAHDVRVLLRQRIAGGDSDAQAVAFIVARYGDFVLMEPPVKPATYVLWAAPPVLLIGGVAVVLVAARRRRAAVPPPPLDAGEQARLASMLQESDR